MLVLHDMNSSMLYVFPVTVEENYVVLMQLYLQHTHTGQLRQEK